NAPIVERGIPYGSGGDKPLLLDILRPDSYPSVVRPLVIWVHGGGWEAGSRDDPPGRELLDRGFAAASISYRFSDESPFPAQIHDVKAAIRFLRANAGRFNIDPDRIGIWGHSAGGHLASLAGMTGDLAELEGEGGSPGVSSAVQAVVPLAGPADFSGTRTDDPAFFGDDIPAQRMLGKQRHEPRRKQSHEPTVADEAFLRRAALASPALHAHEGAPPYLIVHGTVDPVVTPGESRRLAEAVTAAGGQATLLEATGIDHDLRALLAFADERGVTVMRHIVAFFERHLGPLP
ncbi:MAG TPA: alpha/beta hydrolase, partial [Thermomicrobiales bacterium]|nr:alpha/beta hydrolase [Thermomicrobiales bacterium]